MPHVKLTQALVEGLPFQDSVIWYHDQELAGLNLSVGRRTKTFYASGENKGRFIRVKIGRADVTKVNEARAVARDILIPEIRRGIDPRAKTYSDDDAAYSRIMRGIREARPEDLTEGMAQQILRGKKKRRADEVTVGQVWKLYEAHHLATILEDHGPEKARRAETHIIQQRRYLGGGERYGKDGAYAATLEWPNGWWERPITSITPELCAKTWRNLSRTRGRRTAQLFFTSVKVLFNYAVAKEEVPVTEHPLIIDIAGNGRGLPKGWMSLRPTKPVERISDIRVWWRQVDKLTMIPKSALKIMLLTGMRPSEALAMRWDQVDLEAGKVWFKMTKTTGYREVALSSWSVAQLKRLEQMVGRHEYVITGPTGGKWTQQLPNITHGKNKWQPKRCQKEWQTVATEIGVPDRLVDLQVGHSIGEVKSRYIVTPDLRSTVQQVADELMRRVEGAVT
ncbi:MAG: tyrosine-type recombinase/integrase [Planctomycetaceae bacterium]